MIEHRPDRPSPWRARVRAPDGRLVSKSFRTKTQAQQWVEDQRSEMRRGEWVDPTAGDITLTRWLVEVDVRKRIRLADATLKQRESLIRNHIHPSIGLYPLNRITPEALQRWVVELAETLSPQTVRHTYTIVSEALRLAVTRGRILRSPDIEIELPKIERPEHRYLTEDQVWELADAIDPRYRPIILIGAFGGLRPGEIYSAQWVDWKAPRLAVRGTKTKMSRRTVKLPPWMTDELARHRQAYPHVSHIVFSSTGNPVDGRTFRRRAFASAVRRTVGEPMTPNDLRHTHVALLVAEGWHPKGVMERLGHTSIRTTMDTYGHLFPQIADEMVDRLGNPKDPQTIPKPGTGTDPE